MASSFYSNTQHIDFESVLAMNDPGMVSMFQALIASGLEGFLGCKAVFYETALVDLFENASVHDGVIISTVAGQLVEISEEWFAETFELPVDGLADVSEMPKDKFFDARSIVSMSGEPVILSGLKSQMKIHYRLLCDIMAKSISVKVGSFNAITVEKFSLMTAVVCSVKMNWGRVLFGILKKMVTPGTKKAKGFAIQIILLLSNVPNLELGESSEFPSSKILTENTVHRYIAVIDKSGAQDADVAPKATKAPKKRTAVVPTDVPVFLPLAADDTANQPAAVDAFPADRPAEEIESVERVDEQLTAEPAVHVPAEEPAVEEDRVETWFYKAFSEEIATAGQENQDEDTAAGGDSPADKADEEVPCTGIVTTGLDVVEIRRVVKETHQELIAKINSLDEQVAATRNDLLEFSAQAQQSLNVITTQLSELVAYINRGGDNKKGESSSRGPQSQPNLLLLMFKFDIVDMLQVWKSWKRPRKEFVRQIDGKEKEKDKEGSEG
ncbi:hypothetical protein F511_39192 [Dorcoceras hygrometricum]|uniref:Dystroglycan-like n=1 Tax=Dorcoceras hygrometricum TaxID=472368 RepID=A0A2Z7CGY9_9LAMI|nr:hypothetical protein F511_39192 [Dorcoceras hygrometricum]